MKVTAKILFSCQDGNIVLPHADKNNQTFVLNAIRL